VKRAALVHLLVVAIVAVVAGCGARTNRTTNLIDDIHSYNDGVRWHQYPKAAAHVHPKERNAFIAELSSMEEELRIADWELVHLEYQGRDSDEATAHVRYTWHLDSRGIVHTTNTVQSWRRFGKQWLVVGEERVRGEPMPGIKEPDPETEEGDAKAKGGHGGSSESSGRDKLSLRHMMFEFR